MGISPETGENEVGGNALFEYVNMRLSAAGEPVFGDESQYPVLNCKSRFLKTIRNS